ncbi:uncharacterized protein LOC130552866 isoform X1 [Triplophysa rosa]|uniref:uncharacterized protein LOC130552866 isoform X1 n=1 Tax=Triplophysa rosa TaxID=992332 RepID=UPI002545D67B|nr:uncharacterized protein LOC130552866 isoform X1 [Triplophysa rosa]
MEDGKLPGPPPKRARESEENAIKMKIFNDSIHGQIELHPLLVKIIDTPQFQRLRYLKQLGIKYLIYPGATHTRFEHSIGVAYLAGCMVKILREKQTGLEITEQDLLCVQIAALCHDLGHGPFSHLFDSMFIPAVQEEKWEHEEASVDMFNCMLKKNPLMKVMKEYGLEQRDITFIKELIKGVNISGDEWTQKGRSEEKSFLYEIVANKRNGIDVDKWDYLARDCHHLGIPNGFDLQRLLRSARVCNVKMNKNKKSICYRDKVADNIYDMFHTRYTLHRQALQHKIGYIIDVRINDALLKANEKLRPDRKISDAIHNMVDYIKLTDHIFDEILHHSDPQLKEAKDILENIVNRRLPKFVGEARLDEKALEEKLKEELKGEELEEEFKKANKRKEYQKILEDDYNEKNPNTLIADMDLDIYVVDLGFGTEKNPIDDVYFYNKRDPDKAFRMEKWQVSDLSPKSFHEWIVRMYYKNTKEDYQGNQRKWFQQWCQQTTYVKDDSLSDEQDKDGIQTTKNPGKIVNDSIHGHIELDPVLVKIIDTPQFQRLRNIKQLGANNHVFPGATHTRFEHSIGMAYLAGCLAKVLQEKQNKDQEGISEKDILCVQIAALCYNLGHGPFSHMFTKKFMPEVDLTAGEEWKIEVVSVWMFLDIVEKRKEAFDLNKDDIEFICELIQGEGKKSSRTNKPFLYEIVNNKWNSIDVRRWDYFARDCHHLGLPNSFDYQRLLKSARVCEVHKENQEGDKEKHICFKDTVADNVYDMFHTRYTLYRQSYQHKIGDIIEDKIAKALKAKVRINFSAITASHLLNDIKCKKDPTGQKKNKHVDEAMKEFTKLTDHIFEEILYSTDENARKEIEDIVNRRLPKFVGEARLPSDVQYENKKDLKETLKKNWKTALNKLAKRRKTVFLDADDFIIDVVEKGHGMRVGEEKGKTPFDNVYFYNKRNPDKAFQIKKYQVSSLLPEKFEELWVRVYYNKKTDEEEEDAVKCFKQWCSYEFGLLTRIIFYEDENFKGKVYECKDRFPELLKHLKRCHSIRVMKDNWLVFDKADSKHPLCVLAEGDGPNFSERIHHCFCKDCFHEIHLYDHQYFYGAFQTITENCRSLEEQYNKNVVHSCDVMDGTWNLYDGVDYTGNTYTVEEGEYPNPAAWGACDPTVKSLKYIE